MSQQIDSFCEKLRGKLDEMDDRLQQLKASAKAGSEKARQHCIHRLKSYGQTSMQIVPRLKRPRPE